MLIFRFNFLAMPITINHNKIKHIKRERMSIKKAKLNHEEEHPLITELKKHNQEHLIPFITSDIENNPIAQQLKTFSLESTLSYLKEAQKVKDSIPDELIQPVSTVKLNEIDTDKYKVIGEEAIRNGEVAAVILSGGQGTRLGHNGPKGKPNHVTKHIVTSLTLLVTISYAHMYIFL